MKTLICKECKKEAKRTGPMQIYCRPCSEKRDIIRKRKWCKDNPLDKGQKKQQRVNFDKRKEKSREAGAKTNEKKKKAITWFEKQEINLIWIARISVPFTYAMSKNHIYSMNSRGHVFLRDETRAKRAEITLTVKQALKGMPVVHNKVWLDVLVQKPNHKGDAINVVDTLCDAIKDAMPVDDRWFSIRRLDWEIVKKDPLIYIGIGQEAKEDAQICSYCGQIKTLENFNKSKHNPLGVGRECKDCRRIGRKMGKKLKAKAEINPDAKPQFLFSEDLDQYKC